MDYSIYDNVYAGILKSTPVFQTDKEIKEIEYHYDKRFENVISKYHLIDVAGNGTDSEKIIRMVEWMTQHCFHDGAFNNCIEPCAEKLLEFSFDQGKEHGMNCLSLSTALTECLLGLGIRARTMFIIPMSPYDLDNHVVCEAYARDLGKWIMVDPTYGGYITDENGTILNLMEMRNRLSERQKLYYSENYNYNGESIDHEWLTIYYAKDLFFLQCYQTQGYCSSKIENNLRLTFAPLGFDAKAHAETHAKASFDHFHGDSNQDNDARQQLIQRINSIPLCYQHPNTPYQETLS